MTTKTFAPQTPCKNLDVDDVISLQHAAIEFGANGDADAALACFSRARTAAPGDPQVNYNLGVQLQEMNDLDAALIAYRHTLRLNPTHIDALNNISDLLRRRLNPFAAEEAMEAYLRFGGAASGRELRFAKIKLDCRKFDEAYHWFERALEASPGDARTQFEYAMLLLLDENLERGLTLYQSRLDLFDGPTLGLPDLGLPVWRGEPLAGVDLAVLREQGYGDMLMIARFFSALSDAGARLKLLVHPPLARLLQRNFPMAEVRPCGPQRDLGLLDALHRWQGQGTAVMQIPACSILHHLAAGACGIWLGIDKAPYLTADPFAAGLWKRRIAELFPNDRPKVGLALSSRPIDNDADGRTMHRRKSVPATFASAIDASLPICWVGLHDQTTSRFFADVHPLMVVDTSSWLVDFEDTAALIANLDLVVTVDTAVAHLAGAMGKEVWLLLWWNADWRWGRNRIDSYWYDKVRIFRQGSDGDWLRVIEELNIALSERFSA
jgi:Tfp pilus assembly protein PilF